MSTEGQIWYAENSPWPYVHTQTSAALYIATADPIFSFLVGYVAESVEAALRDSLAEFSENIKDSLLADPISNGTAILAFFLLDKITRADYAFVTVVPWWQRIVGFMLVFITAPIGKAIGGSEFYFGILLTYALVLFATLATYNDIIFRAQRHTLERRAGFRVVLWLILMLPYVIASLPVTNSNDSVFVSSWFRTTYVSIAYVLLFGTAAVFTLIKTWP